jgi:hypothetical protein
MPPRWFCLGILGFWLATTGYMFWQDLWPHIQPHEPPPFFIDLVDEAQQNAPTPTRWRFYQAGTLVKPEALPSASFECLAFLVGLAPAEQHRLDTERAGVSVARTWVEYREKPDDSFSFHIEFATSPQAQAQGRYLDLGNIRLRRLASYYRVNRAGQLLEMNASFTFDLVTFLHTMKNVQADLKGEVREGQFFSTCLFTPPPDRGIAPQRLELKPVKVSYHGSILLPLHPVNRIKGLKPGQSWRMPVVDPFGEALDLTTLLLGGESQTRFLQARVLPDYHQLPDTKESAPCLVIEYEDDQKMQPRTWVQEKSGLVLRQEATVFGRRLILQRETIHPDF